MTRAASRQVLSEAEWRAREGAHVQRMRAWTEPHRLRQSRGEAHPVLDFLFTYYSYPVARLERWQPGPGVLLTGPGARRFLRRSGYRETTDGVLLDAVFTERLSRLTRRTLALLEAVRSRRARLDCFGLHEWAMVYRLPPERLRHAQVPLRLGPARTDAVVESMDVRCSHVDAFRFFTAEARPLNRYQPTRETQREDDQPGCLHVGMDLYRAAYKLDPFVPSELLGDCFELAADIRELDMRASPYDLEAYGYSPVPIETVEGRAAYVRAQAEFSRRAAPLRDRLIEHCHMLLRT